MDSFSSLEEFPTALCWDSWFSRCLDTSWFRTRAVQLSPTPAAVMVTPAGTLIESVTHCCLFADSQLIMLCESELDRWWKPEVKAGRCFHVFLVSTFTEESQTVSLTFIIFIVSWSLLLVHWVELPPPACSKPLLEPSYVKPEQNFALLHAFIIGGLVIFRKYKV